MNLFGRVLTIFFIILFAQCSIPIKVDDFMDGGVKGELVAISDVPREISADKELQSDEANKDEFIEPFNSVDVDDASDNEGVLDFLDRDGYEGKTPHIASVTPNDVCTGIKSTITVKGDYFTTYSKAFLELYKPLELPTLYVSKNELQVQVLTTNITGKVGVFIQNTKGEKRRSLTFEISVGYLPKIEKIKPSPLNIGSKVFLSVYGVSLRKSSRIVFNNKEVLTTWVNSKEVVSRVPIDLFISAGNYPVWLRYDSCKEATNKIDVEVLHIDHVAPKIDRILPFSVQIGKKTTLMIYGAHLTQATMLHIDKTAIKIPVTAASSTYATVEVDLIKQSITPGKYEVYLVDKVGRKSGKHPITIIK